jgi:hypothetical protein
MSRAALVNPWDPSTSTTSASAPKIGSRLMLAWFGLCVAAAMVGTTLTAGVPQDRAQVQSARLH